MNEYKESVVVPEMLIKLKQGFGRLIRTETDTGVVAILDSRANTNGTYRQRVLTALPDCFVTKDIDDVENFIRAKKTPEYFDKLIHESSPDGLTERLVAAHEFDQLLIKISLVGMSSGCYFKAFKNTFYVSQVENLNRFTFLIPCYICRPNNLRIYIFFYCIYGVNVNGFFRYT